MASAESSSGLVVARRLPDGPGAGRGGRGERRESSVSIRLSGLPVPGARTALIVEGGGSRGVFCAGVLDALGAGAAVHFDVALGSSAGAVVLAAYLYGEHGHGARAFTEFMLRPGVVDRRRFLRGGPLFDLDRLWDDVRREQPFDHDLIETHPTDMRVVVTDLQTGEAHHLSPTGEQTWPLLKASCALPLLYGKAVAVAGREYIDGGYSDPLPVHQAQSMGAEAFLVIRTRPSRAGGTSNPAAWGERELVKWRLRQHRDLARGLSTVGERYASSLDFTRNPPEGVFVLEVAPTRPLATSRAIDNPEAMRRDYELGLHAGRSAAALWAAQLVPPHVELPPGVSPHQR